MVCVIYFLDFLHVSKTFPAVSWLFSELHFSHSFLRTNIVQHCIRNFLPFPLITDKPECTELLGCGKHLARTFRWRLRANYLTVPGQKTFSALSSSATVPPAPPPASPQHCLLLKAQNRTPELDRRGCSRPPQHLHPHCLWHSRCTHLLPFLVVICVCPW